MIVIILFVLFTNIIVWLKTKNDESIEDKKTFFFGLTMASFVFSMILHMTISSIICTSDVYKDSVYEWKWRERPMVALRTQDTINGTINGSFLGINGTIEGTTYYRYLVKNSNGVIVVRKTEYPNIKIGEIPMERTQMVYHKNPWYSKWFLFDVNDDEYEGYTEIVVPEHSIIQKFEIKP